MTDITVASIISLLAPDAEAKDTAIARQFFLIPSLETARLAESVFLAADIDAKVYPEPTGKARFFVTLPPEEERDELLARAQAFARLASLSRDFASATLRPLMLEEGVKPSVAFKMQQDGSIDIGIHLALPVIEEEEPPPQMQHPYPDPQYQQHPQQYQQQHHQQQMQHPQGPYQQGQYPNPEMEVPLEEYPPYDPNDPPGMTLDDLVRETELAEEERREKRRHIDAFIAKISSFMAANTYNIFITMVVLAFVLLGLVVLRGALCPDFGHHDEERPWYCGKGYEEAPPAASVPGSASTGSSIPGSAPGMR